MSDIAMSNETDLDWLARNVHVWRSGYDLAVVQRGGGEIYVTWPSVCSSGITKKQWLDRRAELQNKPSWKDAPEWASHLAQSDSGTWHWMDGEPEINEIHDSGEFWSAPGYSVVDDQRGEVLGDWRDTLERRPADLSEPAVTARLQEATDNVLAAVPELKSDRYKFEQFTSIEDNQEQVMSQKQEMKQDNGWFERGELPPVGCLCLYVVSDRLSAEVEITAHAKFGLCFVQIGQSGESYVSKTAELHRFRPIRTEREVAIEHIQSDIAERWANCEELAKHLVDKGWVKGGK